MEPEGLIPSSQELSTGAHPELDKSSPHDSILFFKDVFQHWSMYNVINMS
jgi:hypothetical protein